MPPHEATSSATKPKARAKTKTKTKTSTKVNALKQKASASHQAQKSKGSEQPTGCEDLEVERNDLLKKIAALEERDRQKREQKEQAVLHAKRGTLKALLGAATPGETDGGNSNVGRADPMDVADLMDVADPVDVAMDPMDAEGGRTAKETGAVEKVTPNPDTRTGVDKADTTTR